LALPFVLTINLLLALTSILVLSNLTLSLFPVEIANVSAAGKNIPVFESPLGLIDGAELDPTLTFIKPLEFKEVVPILRSVALTVTV
jgi:hypothetical protein